MDNTTVVFGIVVTVIMVLLAVIAFLLWWRRFNEERTAQLEYAQIQRAVFRGLVRKLDEVHKVVRRSDVDTDTFAPLVRDLDTYVTGAQRFIPAKLTQAINDYLFAAYKLKEKIDELEHNRKPRPIARRTSSTVASETMAGVRTVSAMLDEVERRRERVLGALGDVADGAGQPEPGNHARMTGQ